MVRGPPPRPAGGPTSSARYHQRIEATADEELKTVMAHNRDKEKEHGAMSLEWLRRHDPDLDARLRAYLFTEGPITEIEEDEEEGAARGGDGLPGIGSLKRKGDL